MQKEMLSAFMDGEFTDNQIVDALSANKELQNSWHSYHLIRSTLREDIGQVVHLDIADRVAAALEKEPVHLLPKTVPESQPEPAAWKQMPFWQKIRPWAGQLSQLGVAACVTFSVIVGYQHYSQGTSGEDMTNRVTQSETVSSPVSGLFFNNQVSPVSYGMPAEVSNQQLQQLQEQRRRINALLSDYELQRRIYNGQIQSDAVNGSLTQLQVGTQP